MYFVFPWISPVGVLGMFSDLHIPLNVQWIHYMTSDRWTNNNLALQVYCSPSLKELLHNSVMPLLARNKERKEPKLHVHGMWWCVCVVVVCDVCCIWNVVVCTYTLWNNQWYTWWCVCMCGCVHIHLCGLVLVHSERWIQIHKCMYTISNHTRIIQQFIGDCN